MIHFDLKCRHGHRFDGWFRSNDDFERQAGADLIACAICGDRDVTKALMRPALAAGAPPGTAKPPEESRSPTGVTPQPSAAYSPETVARLRAVWSALQAETRRVRETSDYVGPQFAAEARRIHYGESERKSVYGEASRDDVRSLTEEGIVAVPLVPLPEDQN